MNQNAPRGCAARGDEVYAEHTARARKCATSAHFILTFLVIADFTILPLTPQKQGYEFLSHKN